MLPLDLCAQAIRQSQLRKLSKIRAVMDRLHNTSMSTYERLECLEEIRSQVEASWRTDEIRRRKPTPQVGGKGRASRWLLGGVGVLAVVRGSSLGDAQ